MQELTGRHSQPSVNSQPRNRHDAENERYRLAEENLRKHTTNTPAARGGGAVGAALEV